MNPDDRIQTEWQVWDADAPPPPTFRRQPGPAPRALLDLPPQRRLRKRLLRELWVCIGFEFALLVLAFVVGGFFRPFLLLPAVLMAAYIAGSLSGLAVLRRPPPPERPVREHLQLILAHLKRLVRAYVRVSSLAFPLGMLTGMALAWTEHGTIPIWEVPLRRLLISTGIAVGLWLVLAWPLWKFHAWVMKRTYSKDIAAWESALADLSDEPDVDPLPYDEAA